MTIDFTHFKEKLTEEKNLLEKELETVGRRNPDNPSDWEAIPAEGATQEPDETDAADNVEDYGENQAILSTLETKYNDVKTALDKIENGNYGLCEVCGKEIESDRLEANPSAKTCKEHMN